MSKSECLHIGYTVVAALLLVVVVVVAVGQPQSLSLANEGQLQQQQQNSSHATGVAKRAEKASSTGGNLPSYDQSAVEFNSYDQRQLQPEASHQFSPAAQQQSKPQPQISSPSAATSSHRYRRQQRNQRQQRQQQQRQANWQRASHLQHTYNYNSLQGSPNKSTPPMLEQLSGQSSQVSIGGSYENPTFQQQGGIATGAGNGGMGAENNPILYNEPNRTAAIDDMRSGVIYVFIITIFLCFFLILPGIRNDKFPTFLCITTSLIVTSIILISLFGTTWHVAEAPISAAYKAFSRDRIQGDLSVRIGLRSVNITLQAQKYYILHETRGPIIMFNAPAAAAALMSSPATSRHQQHSPDDTSSADQSTQSQESEASKFISSSSSSNSDAKTSAAEAASLADELLAADQPDKPDVAAVDTELEAEEVFASRPSRITRSSGSHSSSSSSNSSIEMTESQAARANRKRDTSAAGSMSVGGQKYTIKRVEVDINYNERFYWIEPNQMAHEHQKALERGLPYPILTVVEYLSQDEGGFNWSRKYRSAGYYTYIILWLSLCVCALMFFLHCAAPRYGIYTMQVLGGLLLFANLTYATLVPRGDQKLVIPFEGQSLTFKFGWSFWLVLIGGCLSLLVGTVIVTIDCIFPNFILTTVLDVDYDSHHRYYKHNKQKKDGTALASPASSSPASTTSSKNRFEKPVRPPFLEHSSPSDRNSSSSAAASVNPSFESDHDDGLVGAMDNKGDSVSVASRARSHTQTPPSSAAKHDNQRQQQQQQPAANGSHKNHNLKSTDHQAASRSSTKLQQRPPSSSSMIESHQQSPQYSHNVRL